jgi:hypothetical protein
MDGIELFTVGLLLLIFGLWALAPPDDDWF